MQTRLPFRAAFTLLTTFCCLFLCATQLQGQCTAATSCRDYSVPYTIIESNPADPLTFSALIGSGHLKKVSASLSEPQYLIICGPVVMNELAYNFAAGSDIIFVNNTSGMQINAGSSLFINSTHIHGCTQLWDRIRVFGRLYVSDSKIEDARTAVHLEPGAGLISLDVEYEGNHHSIYAGSPAAAPGTLSFAPITIQNSIFSGLKPLLQPYAPGDGYTYVRPNIGILAENVSVLNIGSGGAASSPNIFRNFEAQDPPPGVQFASPARGIRAVNSNVNISNSTFMNIGLSVGGTPSYGVGALSSTGTQQVTITGLGGESGSMATFNNCNRAVSASSVRIVVNNCRLIGTLEGIYLEKLNETATGLSLLNVSNCRFEQNCLRGIYMNNLFPAQYVSITKNQFLYNSQDVVCENMHEAIFIRNLAQANASSCTIAGNIIKNEISPNAIIFKGIVASNVNGIRLEENTIEEKNTNSNAFLGRFSGIRIENGNNTIANGNIITGNTTAYTQLGSSGLYIRESNNCVLHCNIANLINQGVTFDGFNCDAANFSYNKMRTHQQGLLLENNTRMGQQVRKQNTWAGSSGQVEGKFNFVGYDPANIAHRNFVKDSKFLIDIPESTVNTRWANPRSVGNDSDASHTWFDQQGNTPISTDECFIVGPNPPKDRSEADNAVIAGTYGPHRGYAATVWEARFHTFGRLNQFPELAARQQPALTWYNANYNTVLGQLYLKYDALVNLGLSTAALESAAANVDKLLKQGEEKAAKWFAAQTEPEKAQIKQDIALLNTELLNAQNGYNAAASTALNAQNSQRQNLLTGLNALSLSTVHEENLRTVLRVLIESNLGQVAYNSTQKATLEGIAGQCRLPGGYGVVLARKALGLIDETYPTDSNCPQNEVPESSARESLVASSTMIYPNPTTGTVFVQWAEPVNAATVSLYDALGRTVRQWSVQQASQLNADVTGLSPGIYQMSVKIEDQKPEVHKLVIVK